MCYLSMCQWCVRFSTCVSTSLWKCRFRARGTLLMRFNVVCGDGCMVIANWAPKSVPRWHHQRKFNKNVIEIFEVSKFVELCRRRPGIANMLSVKWQRKMRGPKVCGKMLDIVHRKFVLFCLCCREFMFKKQPLNHHRRSKVRGACSCHAEMWWAVRFKFVQKRALN